MNSNAVAETAVIVHPENDELINEGDIANIFLSKTRRFPGGATVSPVNLTKKSIARYEFESGLLKMNRAQLKRYWSEAIFSRSAVQPREIADEAEVIKFVSQTNNSIAYVDYRFVDESVKVIHTVHFFTGR